MERYEFDGTKLARLPLLTSETLTNLARQLDAVAQEKQNASAGLVLRSAEADVDCIRQVFHDRRAKAEALQSRLFHLQEDVDWEVYRLAGFADSEPGGTGFATAYLPLRPVDVREHRRLAAGEDAAKFWFETHGWKTDAVSTAMAELPDLVQARMDAIASSKTLQMLERPNYKRRWYRINHEAEERDALQTYLLDALEAAVRDSGPDDLQSLRDHAHDLAADPKVLAVARVLTDTDDPDLTAVLTELALTDAVPYLAAHTFKPSGLKKHAAWQATWTAQRREDAGEDVDVPLPPKYGSGDYRHATYWRLRGKLDVPKERFILYVDCTTEDDRSPRLGWAGWTHAERMNALYDTYREMADGPDDSVLIPLLAGMHELLPWVHQWHGDEDPHQLGKGLGQMWDEILADLREDRETDPEALAAWRPPKKTRGGRRKPRTPPPSRDAVLAALDTVGGPATAKVIAAHLGISATVLNKAAGPLVDDGTLSVVKQRPKTYARTEASP
jgi:hypothetical protein